MKESFVLINKNIFIYNGKKYDISDLESICYELTNYVTVIIFGEEIYTRHFYLNKKMKNISSFIEEKIRNHSINNNDILYDYEEADKIQIAIYSIRGGNKSRLIEEYCDNLEVKPIQVIMRQVLRKILKDDYLKCRVLLKFEGDYYYISLRRGLFYYCFVDQDLNNIVERILKSHDNRIIYCDEKIKNNVLITKNFEVKYIRIEECIYEKVYEKQKIYIRKLL